jgi:hypothetical protein
MLVGGWAPWVRVSAFGMSERVGGLHGGLHGVYFLALGVACLLAAGAAVTSGAANQQVRQVCAGALVVLGVAGLIIVVHEWTTVTSRIQAANRFISVFANSFPNGGTLLPAGFDGLHVSRAWGLSLCGLASAVSAVAGAYLFIVK